MTQFEGRITMMVRLNGEDWPVTVEYEGNCNLGEYDWDKIDVTLSVVDVTVPGSLDWVLNVPQYEISDMLKPEEMNKVDAAVIADMRKQDER